MKKYNSIDTLPIFNFSKVSEEKDLRYLLVLEDYFELPKVSDKEYKDLFDVWERINDDIIDFNGVSDEYKSIMRMRKSIALLKVEMITKDDKGLETIIELKERELLQAYPTNKQDIDESIFLIESHLKVSINIFTCTVKKYYGYIKFIIKNKNG
jgi:hypothetical protein